MADISSLTGEQLDDINWALNMGGDEPEASQGAAATILERYVSETSGIDFTAENFNANVNERSVREGKGALAPQERLKTMQTLLKGGGDADFLHTPRYIERRDLRAEWEKLAAAEMKDPHYRTEAQRMAALTNLKAQWDDTMYAQWEKHHEELESWTKRNIAAPYAEVKNKALGVDSPEWSVAGDIAEDDIRYLYDEDAEAAMALRDRRKAALDAAEADRGREVAAGYAKAYGQEPPAPTPLPPEYADGGMHGDAWKADAKEMGRLAEKARRRKLASEYEAQVQKEAWAQYYIAVQPRLSNYSKELIQKYWNRGMEWNASEFWTHAYAEELGNITDNDERQLVASLLYDMKPEGASTSFREACNRFARGTTRVFGNIGNELVSRISREFLADDEYQALQENLAAVRTATNYKDRTNDWGITDVFTQSAEIVPYSLITLGLTRGAGSVATALGGGAAAAGAAGFAASTGAMWLDEMREMEMQVAAAGGDVTSPGFQRTKAAWAFAHACVESLQWAQLRGLTPLQRADLFGRVFNVARRSGNALMRIAESGVYESLEEDIQDSMEAAFVAYNLDRNVAREAIRAGSEAFAQSIGPMLVMGGGHIAANRFAGNVSEWDVAQMATVVDEINDRAKRKAGMLDLLDDNAFRGTLGRIARGYRAALGQEGGGDAYLKRIGIDDPAARKAVGSALDEMYRAIMRDGPVGEDGVIEQMREQGMIGSDEEEQNLRAAIQSVNADAEARRPGLLRKYYGGRNAKARADVVSQMFPGARLAMDDDGQEYLERDITTRDADGNETTRNVRIAIRYDEGLANPIDPEVANPASPKYDEGADDEIRKGWNAMAESVEGAVQYSPEDWRKLGETDWNAKAAIVSAVAANATREGYFTFTTPEGRDLTREEAERGEGGVMTLNPYALPGVELHEGSHGFVALLRALGILTPDDEANLRQQFGGPKISTESFDEEAFVSAVMKAMAGQVDFADTTMLERVGRGLREFFVKLGGLAGMYREENKWIRARQEDMIQAVLRGDFHGVGANGTDFRTPEPETRGNVAAPPPPPEQPPAETGETAEAEPAATGENVPQGTAETPPAPEPAPAETQPAQPAPAPLPARTTRTTSTSRTRVSGHYEVADAFDGLFISTDEGYDPRGLGYQNRVGEDGSLTTTQGRKDRVRNMANNLAVDILGPNSLADHGAPVLAADMSAVTANTRLEAIRTAYREGKAAEYADAVRGWAAQLGIAVPEGVAHPALVFVLDQMDDEKLLDFVSDANHTGKAAMTDVQQAQEDAGRMRSGGSNVMRLLHPSPTGRLDGVENAGFMTRALDMLGDESLKNSDGTPNAKADRRIRLALLAMALEGSPVRDAVLREAIENYDNLGANRVVSGITAAAPLLAASAQTAEDLDLSGELGAALAEYIEFRRTAATGDGAMEEWLAQDDMFSPRPAAVQTLLREFWARRFSPTSVAALLGEYARRAEAAGSAAQGDLLGDARPEKDAILRMAADATRDEGDGDETRRWSIILGEKGAERLANATYELYSLATAKAALKRWREDGDWEKLTDEQKRRILMATGWQKGADGKWRREAPDFKRRKVAEDKWTVGDDGTRQTALGNLITQSVLFTAYPDMRDMPVTFRPSEEMGATQGYYDGQSITLQDKFLKDGMLTEKGRKTLTHEVQHAIQDREGFAQGSSPEAEAREAATKAGEELRDAIHGLARKVRKARKKTDAFLSALSDARAISRKGTWDDQDVIDAVGNVATALGTDLSADDQSVIYSAIENLADTYAMLDEDNEAFYEAYRRSAGEVEARNAASRKWFPKAGELSPRALGKLLSDTEDVAREDQIVRGVVEDAVQKADRRWSIISTRGAERLGIGTLEEAKNLRLNGADRWEIWQRTGWYVGKDGKWRMEVPDLKLKPADEWVPKIKEGAVALESVADAPELFKAYPALKNAEVSLDDLGWSTGGTSRADLPDIPDGDRLDWIKINRATNKMADRFRATLAHEVQHLVQAYEGMEHGSGKGAEAWIGDTRPLAVAEYKKLRKALGKDYDDNFVQRLAGDSVYSHIAGEVEARNVQKRLDMTPEERAATPPWETEDIDEAEQLVRPQQGARRWSITGIYTGSAADYAERVPVLDKDGNVTGYRIDNGPSLKHIGTGEGSQVYGWGLYGSSVRGVAEQYAQETSERPQGWTGYSKNGRVLQVSQGEDDVERDAATLLALFGDVESAKKNALDFPNGQAIFKELDEHGEEYKEEWPHSMIYEQTFFTNRAEGDDSHLLKWYEPVTDEQKHWILDSLDTLKPGDIYELKTWEVTDEEAEEDLQDLKRLIRGIVQNSGDNTSGGDLYHSIAFAKTRSGYQMGEKAASLFLAHVGIDGVKYPVDSYGGKGVKNGDEVGWNYVSFRDDNIRVDHKWVDGQKRWSIASALANRQDSTTTYTDSHGRKRTLHVVGGNRRYGWRKIAYKHCVDFGTARTGGFTLDELRRYEQSILKDGAKTFDKATGRRTFTWRSPEGVTFTIGTYIEGKGKSAREVVNTVYTDRDQKTTIKMLGTHFKGQAPLGQPSTGNSIPQRPAPVKRNSISITGTDGRMGFGGESYVVAAIATDILVGKKRPDIEYERLKRILAPKSEADVASLVAEARSAVRGDAAAIADELLKAGRPGDAVNAIAAEAEAARMGDALYDAAMGGARAGAKYGRKAQEGEGRAWAKLLNGHNSIGGLHEVSQGVGMGVLAMAEGAVEDSLVREPEARPETARGEPKPKEEKKEPTADEAEAMADAARERAEQTMADWEARERTGQTEKARREKAALEAKEDADATEEEKAAAEDNAEAGDDEDIETPRPTAIPADILAKNNMDVTNAVDFEALLGIAVRNLIIRRSNGAFNAATVWTSAENLLAYRDTLAQLLGDIGKAMMDPANGEEIRRVMKELATLQAYAPRPQSMKRGRSANNVSQAVKHMDTLAAAILTRIFRNAIVKSQKKLTRECGKGIRERRGRTKRIDMMEEDIRSRLFKNDLLLAQFAERCIWWTPTKVAKEAAKLRAVLDARRRAYDEEGRLDQQMLGYADVDQDLVFHRAAMRLALLERYGGMRFKTRGEIKELTAELLGWLDKGLADHAAKWEAQHRIHEREREKAKKAYGRGEDEPRHAEPEKGSAKGLAHRLADAMTATVRQRLDLMSARKGMTAEQRKAAREITDRIMLLISSGSQMRARLQDQYKREFRDALADAAQANGMTARALYTALSAKIDADFSRRISKQGNWGDAALTLDQLLNVYAYLCQTASYADNISKHGRDGQRQEIEDYLARTPEGRAGIRLVQNLREVYRQRRGALSEAWDQFMGTPMFSPDPLYTPVRMHVDGRDGFGPQIEGGWNPVPPGFAERVRNGRDVEETASFTALYAQNCSLAANAIAFGMRGIELRSVLANKEVVAAMERAHGKQAVRDLLNQVADTLNGSAPQGERTYAAEAIKWLNSAATYSSLGFNPFSALKQTTSVPAWSGVLTPEDYAKVARWAMEATYSKDAWAAMRELCDAPGFVARYGSTGFAQSVRDVLKDPEANAWRKFLSLQMQMIQMGDFLPGIMVGQGLYRQLVAKYVDEAGMPVNAAKERAATETWALIEESQQSDKMQNLIKDMRRGGVVAKSLYKFATSPILQASQEIQALRLWKRTGWQWDSDERRRYFNVFMANHFLMPAAMYLVSALLGFVKGREDPWENWQKELAAMFIMGSFSRFFLFGSLTEQAVRTMLGLKVYNNMEMPATQWAQRMATKSAATIADAWDLDADAVANDLWDIAGTMSAPARILADRRRNERKRQKKSKTSGWKGY